jgi:hypothetical protein
MTEATAPEVCLSSVDGHLSALFEAAQRWIHEQGLVLWVTGSNRRRGPASGKSAIHLISPARLSDTEKIMPIAHTRRSYQEGSIDRQLLRLLWLTHTTALA